VDLPVLFHFLFLQNYTSSSEFIILFIDLLKTNWFSKRQILIYIHYLYIHYGTKMLPFCNRVISCDYFIVCFQYSEKRWLVCDAVGSPRSDAQKYFFELPPPTFMWPYFEFWTFTNNKHVILTIIIIIIIIFDLAATTTATAKTTHIINSFSKNVGGM
jgi:hypothetical protein